MPLHFTTCRFVLSRPPRRPRRPCLPLPALACPCLPLPALACPSAYGQDKDLGCLQQQEISFDIDSLATEAFYIRAWHLDDYLALQSGATNVHPFYGPDDDILSEAKWGDPITGDDSIDNRCAWLAETNWEGSNTAGGAPEPLTQEREFAWLPPNTPYVLEFEEVTVTPHRRFEFLYFVCGESQPHWNLGYTPPNYDAELHGFYCPYEFESPGAQGGISDMNLIWDETDGEIKVNPQGPPGGDEGLSSIIGGYYGASVEDLWVYPYDTDAVCEALANGGNSQNDCNPGTEYGRHWFITPQVGPGYTGYDFTFAPADVDLRAAWDWTWTTAAVETARFQSGTRLVVEGDLVAESVTFEEADAGQGWGGIAVEGGTLDLDAVTAEHAETGVTVYQPGTATISNSTLQYNTAGLDVRSSAGTTVAASALTDNTTGVRSGIPQAGPGAALPCFASCRSTFDIADSDVRDNTGTGIFAADANAQITGTTIEDNGGYGLYVSNATVDPFQFNFVLSNGGGSDANGAFVAAGGDFLFSPLDERGLNRIAHSATTELFVSGGGFAFAGDDTGLTGYNAIFDPAPWDPLVYNASKTPVDANFVYWGTGGPPPAGSIVGPVDTTLPLDCDPTVPDPCSSGSRSAAALVSAAAARGGLGEAIRATRAALASDPGAETAAGLVGRLAGLHKRDRSDSAGEHAATFGLLRSLRARLNNPNLPAGLRATAEASLEAVVLDALAAEDYDAVGQALAVWRPRVESEAVLRVLAVVEAALAARGGDYAGASALVAAVAEGEPNAEAAEGLGVLAAYYASGVEESARGTSASVAASRLGAASPTGEATVAGPGLSAWPNPFARWATVALSLMEASDVLVAVYDVLGREVAVLREGWLEAGTHRFDLRGRALPTGVYVVRAETGARTLTERITLVR